MPASDAIVHDTPGGYVFRWPTEQVQITVRRLSDNRREQSTTAEIRVESFDPAMSGHLHQARVNLTSTQAKNSLAKQLKELNGIIDWPGIIEVMSFQTLEMHRQGAPMIVIGNLPLLDTPRYRLKPLLVDGEANMIYGDGGTFKSYLALFISLLVQSGKPSLGMPLMQGNVLYLDWETSDQTANARLRALATGLGQSPTAIHYRRCYSPLADDVEALQQMVYDAKISLVIVDSVAAAAGEELKEAESASHMFNALRSLGTTSLLVTHIPKQLPGQTSSMPYGSVYFRNYTRNAWEIRKVQEAGKGSISLGLYNRKNNDGKLHDDIGLTITFETGANDMTSSVSISRGNVQAVSLDAKKVNQTDRIRELLVMGGLTAERLASQTGIPLESVRSRLSDLRRKGLICEDGDGIIEYAPPD